MPITQARMIRLINAALDYKQALDKSTSKIAEQVLAVRRRQRTAEQALDEISLFSGEIHYLMVDEAIALATVTEERAHFASQMKRNEASRRWQERQRRASGVRPREDTSTSFSLFLPATPRQYEVNSQQHQSARSSQQQPEYRDETEPDFELNPDAFKIDTGQAEQEGQEGPDQILQSTLTAHDIRRLELELAPPGHFTTVDAKATFEEDLLICACGFTGTFQQWQQHLPAEEDSQP